MDDKKQRIMVVDDDKVLLKKCRSAAGRELQRQPLFGRQRSA